MSTRPILLRLSLALTCGLFAAPAAASDDDFEFWLAPSAEFALDADTSVEITTEQKFRDSDRSRPDSYSNRLWLKQKLDSSFTIAGGIERRFNTGAADETRLLQQVSAKQGVLRFRLRFEQRFIDHADRMGLRLRPRIGVEVPLGTESKWTALADAEANFTLRSHSNGGDDGLTAHRLRIGVGYAASDRLDLSLHAVRNQDIRPGAPDIVAYAPAIGMAWSF